MPIRSTVKSYSLLVFTLCIAGWMFLGNLGTYALWDDEAETALGAKGVLATGDTTALIGHNVNARRGGINLRDMADRLTPPLPTYLMALSFKIGKADAYFSRLPFALLGLAATGLMMGWLARTNTSFQIMLCFAFALLGNVSFFLYFRQGRYYGLALFLGIALFLLYLNRLETLWKRLLYSLLSFMLFFSHPIIFAQVQAIIALDWVLFERKDRVLPRSREILEMILPCILLSIPLLLVWNPFLVKSKEYMDQVSIGDRMILIWWNFRDLFRAEFIPLLSLVLAPWAYWKTRNRAILRSVCAIAVVVLITSMITYQRISVTSVADVRYEIIAIVAGFVLSVAVFMTLSKSLGSFGLFFMPLLLWSGIGTGSFFFTGQLAFPPLQFWQELINPCEEPYTPVAQWVNKNISAESTVLVFPDYMMYPLMFHAPQAVYAWQLENGFDPQFANLDDIHFRGRRAPDYLIVFGPDSSDIRSHLQTLFQGRISYQEVARINTFWKDLYRPEIFWRTFSSIPISEPSQGIVIFRLQPL
jgi:hypothetical protein